LFLLETGTELETELELVSIRNCLENYALLIDGISKALGQEYPPIE
jgi:hypothetical protein